MPIPALMGWIGGLSTGAKLSIASSVVSGLSNYAAAKQQRKQALADQDNQYVRMRNAAQRAGFNPLTVLRATGGQGFTALPVISKAAAFGNAAAGIFDALRQSPIDKYNKEIRDLEINQRKADLELMPMRGKLIKAQLEQMNAPILTTQAVPEATKNVLDDDNPGTSANKNLATFDGNVTTDKQTTATETRVRPDGTTYLAPAGEDFDEQILNSLYYAGEQLFIAGNQLSKEGFKVLKSNKKLNPNLPIINLKVPPPPPFLNEGWSNEHKNYVNKTQKAPPLSKLNFGPNYSERLSLEGFAYNY
jgi:hypothetical protein